MNFKNMLKGFTVMATSLALVACGNSGGQSSSQTAEGEPVTIEYWHANADTQGGLAVEELVNKFNESQDEVIVKPVFNADMYVGLMQNLQTSVAAGNTPAIVQIGWAYREYFQNNFEFTAPQDLIDKVSPEDKDYLATKFPEEMLNLATDFEGKQLGLPYSVSTPVIFINEDILKDAGVDASTIKTFADLYAAAATIKEKTGKYGLYIAESNDSWSNQNLVESNGGETVTKEGLANFATPGGIQAYQDWADSIAAGNTLHASTDEGYQAFVSGDVGMLHATIAQRTNVTKNGQFNSSAIQLPIYEGQQRRVPAGGALLAVTTPDEAEQKAAWKFLKFLYEPDNVATWTKSTGYIPSTADATENTELKELIETDQMFQTSYAQMSDLVPFASFPGPNGLKAADVLIDMRDQLFGDKPAEEVVPKAQEDINKLLAK